MNTVRCSTGLPCLTQQEFSHFAAGDVTFVLHWKLSTRLMSTVLLIDDDPSQLKLYTWILQRGSFAVVPALVGSTSVDLPDPANVSVDVVLLDYRLSSQLVAADIAELVRAKFPNAPIIVLSELPFMPEAARAYGNGFVPKGEPEKLLKVVSAAATLSQSRQ